MTSDRTSTSGYPRSTGHTLSPRDSPSAGSSPSLGPLKTSATIDRAGERSGGVPDVVCQDLVRIYTGDGIEVQALQGLNLRIDAGDVVALVGASGSGKSTLLGILSGLDTPTGGSAQVAGIDVGSMTRRQRIAYQRHTVGFVWQQTSRNLMPFLSAAENIALPLLISSAKGRVERVAELLELLDIVDCRDRRPSELSGGQQQRVAIATALVNTPSVLLADEPTGELDEAMSAEVLEAMRDASQQLGVTVLIVTHDPTIAEHVRRTVQIRDGRTSTEVLRTVAVDERGERYTHAQEFTVIDRAGRLQLPTSYVERLALADRVRLELERDHVGVWPDDASRSGSVDGAQSQPQQSHDVSGRGAVDDTEAQPEDADNAQGDDQEAQG
ncbi:MAG: ABC transporter ATP-binding protein [Ornithinimicrobium sp.]